MNEGCLSGDRQEENSKKYTKRIKTVFENNPDIDFKGNVTY